MRKYTFFVILLVGLYFCCWFGVKHLIAQGEAKETIVLECPAMGNATLSHQKHSTLTDCKTCHHTGMDQPKCSSCHTKDSKVTAQDAFHKNCIDCHKEKQKGPTGCMDCHKK